MPPLPSARRGCFQMLAVLVGALMLLPGICAILVLGINPQGFKDDPAAGPGLLIALALGVAGVVLIAWIFRRRPDEPPLP
jgi:hypothetical protein